MARLRANHNTFATGIISKKVQGNTDFEQYNNALSECTNFLVQHTGGLSKRSGTQFVNFSKSNAQNEHYNCFLVPFIYSSYDSYIIEIGNDTSGDHSKFYMRFHTTKGTVMAHDRTVLEINLPDELYSADTGAGTYNDILNANYFQNGNILFFSCKTGTYKLVRNAPADAANNRMFSIDLMEYSMLPLTFMNQTEVCLVPSNDPDPASVNNNEINMSQDIYWHPVVEDPDNEHGRPPPNRLAPVFYQSDKGMVPNPAQPAGPGNYPLDGYHYLVCSYRDTTGAQPLLNWYFQILDVQEEPPVGNLFFRLKTRADYNYCPRDANRAIQPIPRDSRMDGNNELRKQILEKDWKISAFSPQLLADQNNGRGYPTCATVYESRLFLANIKDYSLGIWASSREMEDWFNFTPGVGAGDGIQIKAAIEKADEILWMIGATKLFIGTISGVHIAGSATFNDEAVTPSSFRIREFSSVGASSLTPIQALDAVFFVDNSGVNVHEIVLNEAGMYQVNDLSLLGNDLTISGIIAHAWQNTPVKTYWCATNDGHLCALTYLKNNGIVAWTKHIIAGKSARVLDIITLPSANANTICLLVERELAGIRRSSIEFMHTTFNARDFNPLDQFYLDSAVKKEVLYDVTNVSKATDATITLRFNNGNVLTEEQLRNVMFSKFDGSFEDKNCLLLNARIFTLSAPEEQANGEVRYKLRRLLNNEDNVQINIKIDSRLPNTGSVKQLMYIHHKIIWFGARNDMPLVITIKRNALTNPDNLTGYVMFYKTDVYLIDDQDGRIYIDVNNNNNNKFKVTAHDNEDPALVDLEIHFLNYPAATTYEYPDIVPEDACVYIQIMVNRPTVFGVNIGKNAQITTNVPPNLLYTNRESRKLYLTNINGMIEINNKQFVWSFEKVTFQNNNELIDLYTDRIFGGYDYVTLDNQNFGAYDKFSVGKVYIAFWSVDGLDHLVGETVGLCVNGNRKDPVILNNNLITIPGGAFTCVVGLLYKSFFQTVPLSGGAMTGSSQGSTGHQKEIVLHLYNSLGGRYGATADITYPVPYVRKGANIIDLPEPLFTGLVKLASPQADKENRTVYVEHEDPTAFSVLSITQDVQVSDG